MKWIIIKKYKTKHPKKALILKVNFLKKIFIAYVCRVSYLLELQSQAVVSSQM